MKTRTKVFLGIAVVAVAGVGFFLWQGANRAPVNPNLNAPTLTLEKGELVKTVSASGEVKSDTSANIYSTQSTYPIKEILADTGDAVKKGDVIARLDMSKLENEILQAELNIRSTQVTADEQEKSKANSITNAESSLESTQISLEQQSAATANAEEALRDAEADAAEPFDSYAYDKAIEDARVNVERREKDLTTAQADLDEALNDFDDYSYRLTIREAEIQVERAEENLAKETEKVDGFNEYTYQYAVNTASKNYERLQIAKQDAQKALQDTRDKYYMSMTDAAETAVQTAEKALETAQQAEDDALRAVNKAKEDLKTAQEDYTEAKDTTVENAQKALDDANRNHEDSVTALERAKEDAAEGTQDAYDIAQENVFDARRAYEKALSDKERAIDDYVDANADKLDAAEESYATSQKQLEAQQNALASARNTLEQAGGTQSNASISVEIQQVSLNKLYETLADAEILATEDGIITESNAKVGALPTGILFVIEDTQDLYVSANVKEYNLASVAVGQEAFITTDATGDEIFDAEVSYISPKAVSAAGSTSVEFEIRAKFSAGDAVKIGMNAFLNVVTDTKQDVYSVPLSAIVTDERGSFIYSPNGAERTEIPVTVGIKTTTQGEIAGDGLSDGLMILTQPTELPKSTMPGMMFGG